MAKPQEMILFFAFAMSVRGYFCEPCLTNTILATEKTLVGHCSRTCEDIQLNNFFGCSALSNCTTRQNGGLGGGVHRCDYCECACVQNCQEGQECALQDNFGKTVRKDFIESELNHRGSCIGKCHSHTARGPIRRNELLRGCEQVSNCTNKRHGHIRGFVRCDLCECDCTYPDEIRPGMNFGTFLGVCMQD